MNAVVERIRAEARDAENTLAAVAKAARGEAEATPTADPAPVDPAPVAAVPPPPTVPVQPATVVETHGNATPADDEALRRQIAEFDQKYRSLQGMFARQSADNEQLKRQVDDLLRREKETPAPPAPTAPTSVKRVTDTDVKEYGDELIDLMRRAAQEALSAPLLLLERRVSDMETNFQKRIKDVDSRLNQTSDVVGRTAAERFQNDLTKLVPDWETVDAQKEFLTWLGQRDPLSGIVRQQLLDNAVQTMDVARTAKVFETFKQETGKSASGAPAPKSEPARIDPASLAAPTSSRPAVSTPSATGGKKIYSLGEISKLYDDRTRGRISAAEWTRIEADINLAILEGRVS